MVFLRTSALLLVALMCWVGADFNFGISDLQKELGYFTECKGKKINLPMDTINKAFGMVPLCTLSVPGKAQLTKECVAICVAEQMGIVDSEGKYNYDVATTPLLNTVNETDPSIHNEKWIVEIQTKAIKKCGVDPGQRFKLVDDCPEAKKFDACIKEAAAKECGAPPA